MTNIVAKMAELTGQLTGPGTPFEVVEREFDGIPYRAFKNTPNSVKELLDAGRQHGGKTFLSYEGENLSFDQFFRQVDAIAYQLVHRHNVVKGDRIAIAMRNYPEWLSAFVSIVSLGAVAVPLNSWGQREEIEFGLSDSGARIVFCDQQRLNHIAADLEEMGVHAILARGDGSPLPANAETLERLIEGVGDVELPAFEVEPEDTIMIMYTSGTTGKPKGALSCHRQVCQAIICFEFHAACSAMANMETIQAMMESGFESASLLAVPLFHVSGLYAQGMLSLRGGRKLVMMYKWNPRQALEMIERERITTLSAAPSMVMDVLDHPEFDQFDTSSLFAVGGGGSASPERFTELVYSKLKKPYPGTGYGMTETNAVGSNFTGAAYAYKPKSSGQPSPIIEFKTVDDAGHDLPRGGTGEIWIKSPTVIKEYWQRPEANRDSFRDGWFATGDIGYIDDEGFVFLVDRAKDIIIRGGENIASAEIENLLHSHPAVQEAAAFGVPHPSLGEEVAAAIVTKAGQTTSAEELRGFVAQHLAGFKVPSHIWLYGEPLPRNPSGKVLKKALRESCLSREEAV